MTTKVLFPCQTPLSLFDKPEVLEVHEIPSVEEVMIVPESPTATNFNDMVNDVIVRVLLTLPALSVTVIVQSE